jgi:hypothetical protein
VKSVQSADDLLFSTIVNQEEPALAKAVAAESTKEE